MYKLVTKYTLLGLRPESDAFGHTQMMFKVVLGAPHEFETEQAAYDWALNNHDDMRHHREFVVLAVHKMVMRDLVTVD